MTEVEVSSRQGVEGGKEKRLRGVSLRHSVVSLVNFTFSSLIRPRVM